MRETIAICLATFNGARFLREQLESIWAQTFSDWHLYVRDDGSTDETTKILEAFRDRNPDRTTILPSDGQLGVTGNFERIALATRAPYVAFSDQDDVWYPEKLEVTFDRMQRLEAELAPETPALVHADRRLIDADGREITASYWKSRGVDAEKFDFGTSIAFPLTGGATILTNKNLINLAFPTPRGTLAHDQWLEIAAHAFGTVAVQEGVVLDHRRHGSNASGSLQDADSPRERRTIARARRLIGNFDRQRRIYASRFRQAEAFRDRFGSSLDPQIARQLDRFLAIRHASLLGRLAVLLPNRASPPGLARRLVFAALSGQGRAEVR